MTATYIALATITLTSTDSEIIFSSIPATYRDLVVVCNTRSTRAANNDFLLYQINGDTGSNYAWVLMFGPGSGSGGSLTNTLTVGVTDAQPAANRPAGEFGAARIQLMDYSQTNKQKTILTRTDSASDVTSAGATRWANTNAINQIRLFMEFGSIASGSTFSLYGIN